MIAMASRATRKLLIADEPTTALDVTIQAQILDILRRCATSAAWPMLFITHDLGVIAEIADDVAVMYRGKIVEYGPVLRHLQQPAAPLHQRPARLPPAARHEIQAAAHRQRLHGDDWSARATVKIIEKKLDEAAHA
jgi:ABC-type dipeptide/oligopeptide/nickel transport system ATPase component